MTSSTTLTISFSPRDGLLVHGTSKGDAAGPILARKSWGPNCRLAFRWSNWIDCWYLPHSRGHRSPRYALDIKNLTAELEEAGFDVEPDINDDLRQDIAEAEQEKLDRVEARADRLNASADKAAANSAAGRRAAEEIADQRPMGQPILRGHHSEARARRDQARVHAGFRKFVDEGKKAGRLVEKAEAAEQYEARRYNPRRIMRRLETFQAERRSYQRALEGRGACPLSPSSAQAEIEVLDEKIAFWEKQLKAAEEAGFKIWSKTDFTKGDFVRYRGQWWEVLRANKKSLTIPHIFNEGAVVSRQAVEESGARWADWTSLAPYDEVAGRLSAQEMKTKLEAARQAADETTA